jgi:hypothetical protein
MAQLSAADIASCASYWANASFVAPNAVANYSLTQIQSAISAIDAAFDTTLNTAVAAVGGNTTVIRGLSAQITTSMPGATVAQQTLLVCHVLMKRAGLI